MIVKVNDSADLNLSQKEFERVGSQARDCWTGRTKVNRIEKVAPKFTSEHNDILSSLG